MGLINSYIQTYAPESSEKGNEDEKSDLSVANDKEQQPKLIIIGISGATRSGKGVLAKGLKQHWLNSSNSNETKTNKMNFINIDIIKQDKYFIDEAKIDKELNGNWDCISAIDTNKFYSDIKKKISMVSNIKSNNNTFNCNVLILEGFLLYYDKTIIDLLDVMIWLEIPKNICYQRRMSTYPVSKEYFEEYVWPYYLKYKMEYEKFCINIDNNDCKCTSLVIDATKSVQSVFNIAVSHIHDNVFS